MTLSAPSPDSPAPVAAALGPSPGGRTAHHRPVAAWVSWLTGATLFSAVVVVSLHASEGRQALSLLRHVDPLWLLAATAWQVATYGAQAEVWRVVGRATGRPVPGSTVWAASLAKLFVDQALPTAGVASSVLVANVLERHGQTRAAALAAASLNMISYNAAYVITLVAALALIAIRHSPNPYVLGLAALFTLFCIGLTGVMLVAAGHGALPNRRLFRAPVVRQAIEFVADADAALVRRPTLLAATTFYQLLIIGCDLGTMVALIHAIGVSVAFRGVFISFMVSSLFRTMGFVPGGLGTFEASSVLTLRHAGLAVSAALSTTVLFRALSFWLPMVPGLIATRWLTSGSAATSSRPQ